MTSTFELFSVSSLSADASGCAASAESDFSFSSVLSAESCTEFPIFTAEDVLPDVTIPAVPQAVRDIAITAARTVSLIFFIVLLQNFVCGFDLRDIHHGEVLGRK